MWNCVASLPACALQGGEWERALALFEEMQTAPPEANIAPNEFTYNALISVLAFGGRLDLATEKFREMKEVRRNTTKMGEAAAFWLICYRDGFFRTDVQPSVAHSQQLAAPFAQTFSYDGQDSGIYGGHRKSAWDGYVVTSALR